MTASNEAEVINSNFHLPYCVNMLKKKKEKNKGIYHIFFPYKYKSVNVSLLLFIIINPKNS
jgi:hypothetical protein